MSQILVTGEAKIRDIQGPVVANSGVVTALDGAASQYVRGDGTLADFPTSTGGGSSVSYYLNSSVSQGTIGGVAYRELNKEPIIGAGTDITISANGYVASYITDANDPDVLSVPGGNFNCEFYFSVNNNTGNPTTYAELYKYDGTTFTLLGSSQAVPESLNQGTTIAPYYFAIPVATAALALTDRLAIRIYVNVDGRVVTLHTENSHLCQVVTTFSKGMVSLNNLTDQSQFITTGTSGTDFNIVSSGDTHTFNLPVASATNTGKLSSTDWSTFNNKQNALTNPVTGTGTTNTLPKFTAASTIGNSNITDTGSLITLGSNSFVNGALGIGTTSLTGYTVNIAKNITGATTGIAVRQIGSIQSDVTTEGYGFFNALNTQATVFTLPNYFHYMASQQTIGAGSTVTNQYGFYANSALTGATNNFGFYGNIPSGTNRWNLFMNGTADNYLAGSLGLGSTSLTGYNLRVSKNITGATSSRGIASDGVVQSDVVTAYLFATNSQTAAATFSTDIVHYFGSHAGTGAGSTITSNTAFMTGNLTGTSVFGFRALSSLTGSSTTQGFRGDIAAATNNWNLYMNGTANNYMAGALGIGSTSLTGYTLRLSKSLTGSTSTFAARNEGVVLSDVTADAIGFRNDSNTQAAAFTLTNYWHFWARQGSIGAGSAITNQYGYVVDSNMIGATNNYAFQGNIPSGTNRWNLYMAGTAANFLAGDTGIGTQTLGTATQLTIGGTETAVSAIARGQLINTTLVAAANNDVLVGLDINPTFTNGAFTGVSNIGLRVGGNIRSTLGNNQIVFSSLSATTGWQFMTFQNTGANMTFGIEQSTGTALFGNSLGYATVLGTSNATALQFGTNALTRATIFSTGNLGINTTTDAGFRLDVNGTARVQGAITGTSTLTLNGLLNNSSNEGRFNYLATGGAAANTSYGITVGAGRGIILQSGGNTVIDFANGSSNNFTLRSNTTNLNSFGALVFGNTTTDKSFFTMDLISNNALFSDSVAIIATSITMQASALVAMNSTTKGFLPPRMTAAQRAAIANPATGLMVYQTDGVEGVYVYSGGSWKSLTMV